jgi:O-antigen/teichoic acid export membrane protein
VSADKPPLEEAVLSAEAAEDVRTVAKGGATQIIGQISQQGLGSIFSFVAARVLAPAGLGLYRQVAQVLLIGGQLGLAGFNYASMRFIARARAARDHAGVRGAARVGLTGAAVSSLLVGGALVLLAGRLAALFHPGPGPETAELAGLLRLGAAYIPVFAMMQVLRYCTQAYKTMVPSVIAGNIIQPCVRFVLGVGLLMAGFGVAGAVSTLVASMAVGALAALWFYARMLTGEERAAAPRSQPLAMIRFALPQGGSSLLGIQALGLGIIVLGIVRSDAEVGLFAVALALQGPGGVFLSGIVNIWAPVVSDLHEKGDLVRLESLYQTITRWVVTFSLPVFAVLILEPDLFVRLFAGSGFADAAPVVAILALGNIFYTGTGPTGYVLSMTGRPGVNFINSIAAVGLYVGLGAWVVPEHGVVGMAVVDAVVTALVNSARLIEAKTLVGVQPFGRSFAKPVVATGVAATALWGWGRIADGRSALEIGGIAGAAVLYLVALRLMGLDAEERYVWKRIKTQGFKRPGKKQ